jgi:mandelate racemase
MPKIKSLSVKAANIPLNRIVVGKVGKFKNWAVIVTEITCSDGTIGKGYIGPYLANYMPAIASAIKELFKNIEGREIAPYQFYNEVMNSTSLMGRSGIATYALAALDISLWDASSKIANEPLCVHLGGSIDPVKSYNSCGLWLDNNKNDSYEEAQELIEVGGFDILKIRLGRPSIDEDLLAIENVKKALGKENILLCDFNQGYNLPDAIHFLNILDDKGLYWFEEPIDYYNYDGYKELRSRMNTPIILGENFHGPDDAFRAMEQKICDFIMPDLMRICGISGWIQTASIAAAYRIRMSSHLFPEVSSQLMRVTPTAHLCEWTDWTEPMLEEPYKLKDGNIIIPNVPGTGIDFREDILEKYKINI